MSDNFPELIKLAILSVGDMSLLDRLRSEVAAAPRDAISNLSQLDISQQEGKQMEANPDWVAKVYEALGGMTSFEGEEEVEAILRDRVRAGDTVVAEALCDCLLPNLPDDLRDWEKWFAVVVDDCEEAVVSWELFLEETEFKCSEESHPWIRGLLGRGLSPFQLFDSVDAISSLLIRLMTTRVELPAETGMDLEFGQFVYTLQNSRNKVIQVGLSEPIDHLHPTLPRSVITTELSLFMPCELQRANELINWVFAVAQVAPRLIPSFLIEPRSDRLIFSYIPEDEAGLHECWTPGVAEKVPARLEMLG